MPEALRTTFVRFTEGPTFVRDAAEGIDPGQLNRPGPEGWSIRDVLIHLADAELVGAVRFRLVLAEDEPALPTYDQDLWKKRLQYLWRSPEAALSLFQQTRFATAEMLQQCSLDAWDRAGIHPQRGRLTLAGLLETYTAHVDAHIAQIAELRAR